MKTRRWITLGMLFSGLVGGCGDKVRSVDWRPDTPDTPETSKQEKPVAPAQGTTPPRPGDRMDANAGTADALAQKAESYTREMAALMQARRNAPQLPAVPSQVEWIDQPFPDSSDFRLGGEPAARPAAAVQPPADPQLGASPPTANPDDRASGVPPLIPLARPPAEAPTNPEPATSLRLNPALADATPKSLQLPAPLGQDPLSLRVDAHLKDSPKDVWTHTEYQLLRLLRDEPAPDMSALASLPPEDRELVTALIDGLTNFRNGIRRDSNMLLSAKIRPIVDTAERLRNQAELTIPVIALCTKVDRFGVYDPIEPARFAAQREHPVIVYCEVANFMSSLNADNTWQAQLQWDMTLYTEQSIPVWSDKTQVVEDESKTRRHDFFVRKLITVPSTLPVGRYLLKVTIVDKQSNHVAESTIPIVIAAQ